MAETVKYHPSITTDTGRKVVYIIEGCNSHDTKREDISRKTHLIEDLAYESTDILDAILYMESKFNIDIPDVDAEKLKTIGAIIDYVDNILARKLQEA